MTTLFPRCRDCGAELGYLDHATLCPDCRKKQTPVDFSAGLQSTGDDDPALALSLSISKMVSGAREQGIRDGLTAAGRGDAVAMVDRMQAELTKLRESEAKAWGLVEETGRALAGSEQHDCACVDVLERIVEALAARKTGL